MTPRGGGWLVEDTPPDTIVTPETFGEEHRLIARTADAFVTSEILPALDRLEQQDWTLARDLVRRCGALGLLGTDVPESYGGVDIDKVSSCIVAEAIGRAASFSATFGGQAGLAIMPLLCFGSDAQQARYLPRLVSGEIIGAYALSEAGSGSDALSAKTRATLRADGSYALSGEKLWITNGAFADLFVVFAKVDDAQFTAFVVERGFGGVSSGGDEHKLGLHGSSTTPLLLQDVVVPAENVLGEIGKGHKVAFNTLNYGRFKLAAACSGGAREALADSARYALERKQFGRALASFGAVKHKLGEMAIRAFAVESMLYRSAGLLDDALGASAGPGSLVAALEELAIEASILKVAASEMLDFVVDENVQIHGGNGFVRDYPAERRLRDARVNRIFEGTNEINRLLIPTMLVRRALNGRLPALMSAATAPVAVQAMPSEAQAGEPLAAVRNAVTGMKVVARMLLGDAVERFGDSLAEQQEILCYAADVVIDVFAAESSLLRATAEGGRDPHLMAAALVVVHDAAVRVEVAARSAWGGMFEGDVLGARHAMITRTLPPLALNTVAWRRQVAEAVLTRVGYPFTRHRGQE